MTAAKTWRDAFGEALQPRSTEEIATPAEHECERTFLVDGERLIQEMELPEPWLIVQGYFDAAHPDDEVSMRLIPARELAFMRRKSKTYTGVRAKISAPVDYTDGVAAVQQAPRVALKARYMVRDEFGRAWLVDYFPDLDRWVAETEYPDEATMRAHDQYPDWITAEVTGDDRGYTREQARVLTKSRLGKAMKAAYDNGNRAMYRPTEETGFEWVMDNGRWQQE